MSVPDDHNGRRFTRREMLTMAGGAFVLLLTPAALRRPMRVTRSIPVMGTVAEVLVVDDDRSHGEWAIDLAFEQLRWVDATMSRFNPESDIGRVNALGWRDAVTVDRATAAVVREAIRWAELSQGRFDPGLARLSEVWDVGRRRTPPPEPAFARLAGRRLYRAIEVGTFREHPVIRLGDRDAGIDLGGIAKGFAVDRASATLRAVGIRSAVVNAGGDLYAMGRSEDGDRWRVGIRSAADPSRIEGQLELQDEAVATSGDYFQGFDYLGRRYHHIMDPARAEPRVTTTHSITVRAPDCLTADAAATAGFGMERPGVSDLLSMKGASIANLG